METVTQKKLPNKEERAKVGKAADAIYAPLRERLENEHWGEYISINVDNGDYALATDHLEAVKAIKAKYPGIIPFTIRIGYKAIVHFGGTGVSDGKRPQGVLMITGTIEQSRYPHIVLSILDRGNLTGLEFLVDSGFDDEVALSYYQADLFKLEIQDYVKVTYASGKWENELIARGKIVWFGEERDVRVILSNDEQPAIGTGLLNDCVMTMNFRNDTLTIEKLAS